MLKTKSKIALLFFALLFNWGICETNWLYMSHYEIHYQLNDDLSIGIKPKFWFNGIINDVNSYHLEVGIDKKITSWFTISPYYRHIIYNNTQKFITEYRPQVDLTFSGKYSRLSVQNRNRIEYRIKANDTSFRYRNRLRIKYPIKNVWISIAEEPFIDCTEFKFNKNRFYLNLTAPINNRISTELSYVMEHCLSVNHWEKTNVLVTTFKLKL